MKNKLYILTDKTLDPIYGAVQGGHAVAEWLLENWQIQGNGDPAWEWRNDYLIYLSADVNEWYERLAPFDPSKYKWTYFIEPDLGNKMTAIAIYENDFPCSIKQKLKREKLLNLEGK